jgi:hypothetical protein
MARWNDDAVVEYDEPSRNASRRGRPRELRNMRATKGSREEQKREELCH